MMSAYISHPLLSSLKTQKQSWQQRATLAVTRDREHPTQPHLATSSESKIRRSFDVCNMHEAFVAYIGLVTLPVFPHSILTQSTPRARRALILVETTQVASGQRTNISDHHSAVKHLHWQFCKLRLPAKCTTITIPAIVR